MAKINNDWLTVIGEEFEKQYYLNLRQVLIKEYNSKVIYPIAEDIFNAFHFTPLEKVKVLLVGQDPYHNPGQAHGLSFSVAPKETIPPSLMNIYKELQTDLGCYVPNNGYLEKWAKQGVLLLNTALTVLAGNANSHSKIGWEIFTDNVIKYLNRREEPLIFILWGNNAKSKKAYIDTNRHYILETVHPSPLSANRGFFGCGHFMRTNEILKKLGKEEIDWQI